MTKRKHGGDDSPPPTDRMPTLKITVTVMETDDELETLYTDASWFDVREVLQEHLDVFDTEQELDDAREGNCNG